MRKPIRAFVVIGCAVLVVAGCSQGTKQQTPPPASSQPKASSGGICADVGGSWDQATGTCVLIKTTTKGNTVKVTANYPVDLVDDNPTSGPALKDFLRAFFARFPSTPNWASDVEAHVRYQTYEHRPDVKSIVFSADIDEGGAHPYTEINTFTFDFDNKKQLALADLFCPGVDPLKAVPPLARPYAQRVLDTSGATIPIGSLEPQGDNHTNSENYSDNYQGWYLDHDDLVLVMPTTRAGTIGAGMLNFHVPLSALQPIMPGGGCQP